MVQIRWQGNALLFTGDLCNWDGIKHRVHSLRFLKVPHHGGNASYLSDNELLSRMFPADDGISIMPTCYPLDNCGANHSRPDAHNAALKLNYYSIALFTHQWQSMYRDFIFNPI